MDSDNRMDAQAEPTSITKRWFRLAIITPVLASACLVIMDRQAEPFPITYDMGIQLNAAENLAVMGRLNADHFAKISADLAAPPSPPILTWFPPGFSIAIATLKVAGISTGAALRIFDSLTLLAGWFAWAAIYARIASGSSCKSRTLVFLSLPALIAMPLALSPWSGGTDAVLWAAIPWSILVFPHTTSANVQLRLIASAAISATAIYFRYAALFLPFTLAIGVIFTWMPSNRRNLRHLLIFTISTLVCVTPLVVFNSLANKGTPAPPYTWQTFSVERILNRLTELQHAVRSTSSIFGLAPLDRLQTSINSLNEPRTLAASLMLASLFVAAIALGYNARSMRTTSSSTAWMLIVTPLALVMFLALTSLATSHLALSDGRYYMPIVSALPVAILGLPFLIDRTSIRIGAIILSVLWSSWFCIDTYWARPWRNGDFPLNAALSKSAIELYSTKEYFIRLPFPRPLTAASAIAPHFSADAVYPWIDEIRTKDSKAIFFIQHQPYFLYREARSQIRGIPEQDFWTKAFSSKAVHVYLLTLDRGDSIQSSLTQTPLRISNHLPVEKVGARSGWALFSLFVPANARLYQH
jgi:hypothetical protein